MLTYNILKPVRTAIERAKETQKKNSLTAYLTVLKEDNITSSDCI